MSEQQIREHASNTQSAKVSSDALDLARSHNPPTLPRMCVTTIMTMAMSTIMNILLNDRRLRG